MKDIFEFLSHAPAFLPGFISHRSSDKLPCFPGLLYQILDEPEEQWSQGKPKPWYWSWRTVERNRQVCEIHTSLVSSNKFRGLRNILFCRPRTRKCLLVQDQSNWRSSQITLINRNPVSSASTGKITHSYCSSRLYLRSQAPRNCLFCTAPLAKTSFKAIDLLLLSS